jgi:hypothetical protein
LTADTEGRSPRTLDLPGAEVVLYPALFSAPEADRLLRELRDTTAWRQETITFYGKMIDIPCLTAWYGDAGTGYAYSGIRNEQADPVRATGPPGRVPLPRGHHCRVGG